MKAGTPVMSGEFKESMLIKRPDHFVKQERCIILRLGVSADVGKSRAPAAQRRVLLFPL